MADDELELTGETGDRTLIELLKSMAIRDRETGTISLECDGVVRTIYVREGRVLFANSTSHDERLGEVLVAAGIITPKQFYDASAKLRPGTRLGGILIEMEALTPEDLLDGVRRQVLGIIETCFCLRHGSYRMKFGTFPSGDMITLQQTTEELLMRGILAINSFSRVMEGIGQLETVYAAAEEPGRIAARLELDEEESHILSLINGKLNAGQICEMAYGGHFKTLKILWAFTALDLIQPVEAPMDGSPPPPPAAAGAGELLEQANLLLRAVHDALAKLDIGAANRAFAEAWGELSVSHEELTGTEFDSSGQIDPDTVLYNLTRARCPDPASRVRGLIEEMLMTVAFKARELVGPEAEKAVGRTVASMRANLRA